MATGSKTSVIILIYNETNKDFDVEQEMTLGRWLQEPPHTIRAGYPTAAVAINKQGNKLIMGKVTIDDSLFVKFDYGDGEESFKVKGSIDGVTAETGDMQVQGSTLTGVVYLRDGAL